MSVPQFPVYLFDIDGTLVDSAEDICGAVQAALAGVGRTDVDFDFLKGYIGRHLYDLFRDLGFPESQHESLLATYREIYAGRKHANTRLYPGVRDALATLGGRKSTATTKGTPTTRIVLEMFGLLPFFDHVQGTDGFPAKPEPDVLFTAPKALDASASDCLFVGDSPADMEAGRRAGVMTCAVTYGYGKRDELARWSPDFWIDSLHELNGRSGSGAR